MEQSRQEAIEKATMTTKEQKAREYGLKKSKPGDEFGYSAKFLAYLAGYSAAEEKYREVVGALRLVKADRWFDEMSDGVCQAVENALKNLEK